MKKGPLSLLLSCISLVTLMLLFCTHGATHSRDSIVSFDVKPVLPFRVVTFGTSLTAVNGWPDRLEKALSRCFLQPVELSRVAVPGMGSTWALTQVDHVIEQKPDLVLMEFAINDADIRDGLGRKRSKQQHSQIITRLQEALPETQLVLMTMSPAQGLRRLTRPYLSKYYADTIDLALEHRIGVVDLFSRWKNSDLLPFEDGLHPGDDWTQEIIDPALLSYVLTATGLSC